MKDINKHTNFERVLVSKIVDPHFLIRSESPKNKFHAILMRLNYLCNRTACYYTMTRRKKGSSFKIKVYDDNLVSEKPIAVYIIDTAHNEPLMEAFILIGMLMEARSEEIFGDLWNIDDELKRKSSVLNVNKYA